MDAFWRGSSSATPRVRGRGALRMHALAVSIALSWMMSAREVVASKARGGLNDFHRKSMTVLQEANVPFLIGGAYVVEVYAGVTRRSKDFDLYVPPHHVDAAIDALARAGYKTEKTFPHWLAKAGCGRDYIDLIFRAGNGLCEVDDSWFERAHDGGLLGLHVRLCAPEEMIWMKAYIMERERFDGADIAHLLESCAERIDWPHLVHRFGPDWRVLLSHLVLFGYIYPSERDKIPAAVMDDLVARLRSEVPAGGPDRVCRGTLLSRKQYLLDIKERGFRDARLEQRVHMDSKDITHWTKAIAKEEKARRAEGL
jgi:putative nucleotidyltransferase-like protein